MGCRQSVNEVINTAKDIAEVINILRTYFVQQNDINYAIYHVYKNAKFSVEDLRKLYAVGYKFVPNYVWGCKSRSLEACDILQKQKLQVILHNISWRQLYIMLFQYKERHYGTHYVNVYEYHFPNRLPSDTIVMLVDTLIANHNTDMLLELLNKKIYDLTREETIDIVNKLIALNFSEKQYLGVFVANIFRGNNLIGTEMLMRHAIQHKYVRLYMKLFHNPGLRNKDEYLDLILVDLSEENCLILEKCINTDSQIIKLLNYAIDKKYYNTVKTIILSVNSKNKYNLLRAVYDKVPEDPVTCKLFKTHDVCYLGGEENIEGQTMIDNEEGVL